MEAFDVTMTATLRPELIERTLNSFHTNLWKDWISYARFYVNVDPAGSENEEEIEYKQHEIQNLFKAFLSPNEAVINFAKKAHFPTAWLWCINQTQSDFVFHLEEDWELNFEQDFETMYGIFQKHEYRKLKHLRLSQFVSTEDTVKMWGKYFANWNGDFYLIEKIGVIPVGWCGHPSLNVGSWIRTCANLMDPLLNPEKQFHHNAQVVKKCIKGNDFGVFQPQNAGRAIRDIGRVWMGEHGYVKEGGYNAEWFTNWKKT